MGCRYRGAGSGATNPLPRILPLLASLHFCCTLDRARAMLLIGPAKTLPIFSWPIILGDPSSAAGATPSVLFPLSIVGIGLLALRLRRGPAVAGVA